MNSKCIFFLLVFHSTIAVVCVECRLVNIVLGVMSDVFPKLKQHKWRIRDIIADEEESFGKTLLKVSMFFIFLSRSIVFDIINVCYLKGYMIFYFEKPSWLSYRFKVIAFWNQMEK